jgi:outer membrane receptor for ferrienterochelin and colicins
VQLEAGLTLQKSIYDKAVEHISGLEPKREFLRSPNEYGYLTLSFTPGRFNASASSVYTGKMLLPHLAGAPEQTVDAYVVSPTFTELNAKISYTFSLPSVDSELEIFSGVKNLTNAYQSDFDSGKNRDSNYVYGPGLPRSIYFGIRLKSL